MISPIQLTPNMDMSTLTNALNDMFRQIESENRTQVKTASSSAVRPKATMLWLSQKRALMS